MQGTYLGHAPCNASFKMVNTTRYIAPLKKKSQYLVICRAQGATLMLQCRISGKQSISTCLPLEKGENRTTFVPPPSSTCCFSFAHTQTVWRLCTYSSEPSTYALALPNGLTALPPTPDRAVFYFGGKQALNTAVWLSHPGEDQGFLGHGDNHPIRN